MDWLMVPVAVAASVSALMIGICYSILAVERGERVRLSRAAISTFARECAVHWAYAALAPFGMGDTSPTPAGPTLDPPQSRTPVLLVHGYGVNAGCLLVLATTLRQRGFRWVWPVTLRGRGLDAQAASLAVRIDRLRQVTGFEQVDLVCHSMGGVVAAIYLQRGSKLAVFGQRDEAEEMLYGHPRLMALGPLPVPVTSLYSFTDHMVIPSSSAVVDWAESVEVPWCGHMELLFSARVYRALVHLLTRPGPGEPTPAPAEVTPEVDASAAQPDEQLA
ncbi:alpha/beta fold hydrolase [Myxococcota bacterium]|nr:alpha/beta fold hydrolase [Myxococcota bacterium]